jgi:hypothetical protein
MSKFIYLKLMLYSPNFAEAVVTSRHNFWHLSDTQGCLYSTGDQPTTLWRHDLTIGTINNTTISLAYSVNED